MLPKSNRLPSLEIRSVLRHGKRLTDKNIQIVFASSNAQVSRFAFVVSTKIDKRATRRNRIKRVMREAVRALIPRMVGTFDVVVQARSGKEAEIKSGIEELFRQAHLLA